MNNYDNCAIPGLNSNGDDLFDFEAASSNTLWPGTHNNSAQQTQTVQAEEVIHVMPLTKSEIEAILALRASNTQNRHHAYNSAPPEPNTNFSRFEDPGAYGASFNYDGAESLISTNFNDFDMPDYGNAPLNALDSFGIFEQPRFEEPAGGFELGEPAGGFGALTDYASEAVDQLG